LNEVERLISLGKIQEAIQLIEQKKNMIEQLNAFLIALQKKVREEELEEFSTETHLRQYIQTLTSTPSYTQTDRGNKKK
jgi:hypothetical protein